MTSTLEFPQQIGASIPTVTSLGLWPTPVHPRAKVPSWECHTSQKYLPRHNLGDFSCNGWPWNRRNTDLDRPNLATKIYQIHSSAGILQEIGRNVLEFCTRETEKKHGLQPRCQPLRSPQERFWCLGWPGVTEACCSSRWGAWGPWMLAMRCPVRVSQLWNGDLDILDTCNLQVASPRRPRQAALAQGEHHRIHAPNLCLGDHPWGFRVPIWVSHTHHQGDVQRWSVGNNRVRTYLGPWKNLVLTFL